MLNDGEEMADHHDTTLTNCDAVIRLSLMGLLGARLVRSGFSMSVSVPPGAPAPVIFISFTCKLSCNYASSRLSASLPGVMNLRSRPLFGRSITGFFKRSPWVRAVVFFVARVA